jgi:hypothetical protein
MQKKTIGGKKKGKQKRKKKRKKSSVSLCAQ